MNELMPKTSAGHSRSLGFHTLESEAPLLDTLCLATAGEAEATVRRERTTKIKPTPHSIEIIKQLIEFIQNL
jgi:hypothetical protein